MWTKKQAYAAAPKACVFFKLCALLCALALIFSACASSETQQEETEPTAEPLAQVDLKAPYAASDSLNPFYCTTSLNASLQSLLYEGLFSLQTDLTPQPVVAVSYTEEADSLKVVLPTTGVFSDGSAVTSADVVYSFEKAKNSARYSQELLSISEATADSPLEVTFRFSDSLPNRVQLLTFPIVKNRTAESADSQPVGTGKYVLSVQEDTVVLTRRADDTVSQVRSITLVPVSDSAKLMYTLQTGEIDFFVSDLYGARISRSSAKMVSVPCGNLVFMGVNSNSYSLSFENVRQAISLAMNREEIAGSVYSGNATASVYPLRPGSRFYTANVPADASCAVDYTQAENLLVQEGYTNVDAESGVRSGDKGTLRLTLLVNSESGYREETAVCIQDSLARVGIGVTIQSLPYEEYIQALTDGNYDLYLGEVKLPNNGSLSAFFGGGASYGISEQSASYLSWQEVTAGTVSMAAFLTEFDTQLPFFPLVFRNDVLVCSDWITVPESGQCFADCYSNIAQWRMTEESATSENTTE